MTKKDEKTMELIKRYVKRGHDVMVTRDKEGNIKILEINKKIISTTE